MFLLRMHVSRAQTASIVLLGDSRGLGDLVIILTTPANDSIYPGIPVLSLIYV